MNIKNYGDFIDISFSNTKSLAEQKRLNEEPNTKHGMTFTHIDWDNDRVGIIDALSVVCVDNDELIGLIDQIDLIVYNEIK